MNSTEKKLGVATHIRWAIRRDMPELLAIENLSFLRPWSEDDLISHLKQRTVIAMVAEVDCEDVVGYFLYELKKTKIKILKLAVLPSYRGKSVGRQMISKLIGKLTFELRNRLVFNVRESNLNGQLFLKRMGFWCEAINPEFFSDTDEDALEFVYRFKEGSE